MGYVSHHYSDPICFNCHPLAIHLFKELELIILDKYLFFQKIFHNFLGTMIFSEIPSNFFRFSFNFPTIFFDFYLHLTVKDNKKHPMCSRRTCAVWVTISLLPKFLLPMTEPSSTAPSRLQSVLIFARAFKSSTDREMSNEEWATENGDRGVS